MDLQVQVILSRSRDHAVERAFCDKSILPSQRKDVLDCHIIKLDAGNITRHDFATFVNCLPNHTWNVRHGSERRLHFLHFVRLDREVVRRQNPVDKLLLLLAFKRDLNLLIHQEVRPVLTNLFRHTEACTVALCPLMPVISPVLMEPLDFADVPRLPKGHVCIEFLWDCRIPEFL